MVGSIPKINPSLQDPCHDDQAFEVAGGSSQKTWLDGHAPVGAPDYGQPIVTENQTYASEDEWLATEEEPVPATSVDRVLNSTSKYLSHWLPEDLDTRQDL